MEKNKPHVTKFMLWKQKTITVSLINFFRVKVTFSSFIPILRFSIPHLVLLQSFEMSA
jgi:hypothetical protein